MSLSESFLHKLRQLPLDRQQEALDFVEFLSKKIGTNEIPRRSVKGLWSNLGFDVTEQDIAEARAECWGNFPHKDI